MIRCSVFMFFVQNLPTFVPLDKSKIFESIFSVRQKLVVHFCVYCRNNGDDGSGSDSKATLGVADNKRWWNVYALLWITSRVWKNVIEGKMMVTAVRKSYCTICILIIIFKNPGVTTGYNGLSFYPWAEHISIAFCDAFFVALCDG